ncbi:MAG: hypothetical protein AAGA85_01220 [Bacteroidota bacterium]
MHEGEDTVIDRLAPYISPDGKYLFFSRRDHGQNATSSNIYWVSWKVIEPYLSADQSK